MSIKGFGSGLMVALVLVALFILLRPMFLGAPPDVPAGENKNPVSYTTNDGSVTFAYPTTYALTERKDGFENKDISVITLIPKDVVVPDMSEGPTAISIIIVPNPENLSLEEWIRTKSISNFNLSPTGYLKSATVGGEQGYSYRYSGLYENNAVAVAHGGTIYLITVGWLDVTDQIVTDWLDLITSVQFN